MRPGQTVAIVGAGGGLGSLAQQYAKAMGLRVIAIDTGDEKKKMCLEQLGAEAFVDFATSKNVVKDVQAQTEDGLGPHAVILVAVNERPFQQATEVRLTVFFPASFFPFSYPFHAPFFPFRLFFPCSFYGSPLSSLTPCHSRSLSHPRSTHQLTPPSTSAPAAPSSALACPPALI